MNMKTLLIVMLLAVSFVAYKLSEDSNKLKNENNYLTTQIDSLKNEVFILSTNQTRYEIAEEMLKTEYKECGEKYDEVLSKIE